MKAFLLFVLLLCAAPVWAYDSVKAEPNEAYDIILMEGDPYVEKSYLGDLEDFPDMYEFTTDVAIDLRLQLKQKAGKKAQPFGLIIVRQNEADGGVTEVIRQNTPLQDWQKIRSNLLGISFLQSIVIQKSITPGTYRIEVSTPDNKGSYMLNIGEEPVSVGYFKTLGQIYTTQRHFDFTPVHFLFSSYVYPPVLLVLAGFGFYRYRRYKKENYDYRH